MTSERSCAFTVCNLAYLPRALVLADSVYEHSGLRLKIYVFDRKRELAPDIAKAEIHWIEDAHVELWAQLAFLYDVIELTTCLKAHLAATLLATHNKVVFLDPDTCVFRDMTPIWDVMDRHEIVLTPHYTTPQPDTPDESDLAMMRFGSFNLGFFAVRAGDESQRFLAWWNRRCRDFCFMESQFGLSTDQKWISIAPCLFPSIHISFDLGWNMAPWNTFERQLTKTSTGELVVNGKYPLQFFHFSNFDAADPGYLSKRASSETGKDYPLVTELSVEYRRRLDAWSVVVGKHAYSFDYMSDGTYISPTLRRAYAAVHKQLPGAHDPFDASGPVGEFARKNYLTAKSGAKYSYPGLKELNKHRRSLAFVNLGLRAALRLLGPNRFYDISKLLVFLSMYRKNVTLWRI